LGLDPNPTSRYRAIRQNRFHYLLGGIDGDSKANTHIAATARIDGGIDAD
jgi:hypothetical protein